jgi:hypothetical protein
MRRAGLPAIFAISADDVISCHFRYFARAPSQPHYAMAHATPRHVILMLIFFHFDMLTPFHAATPMLFISFRFVASSLSSMLRFQFSIADFHFISPAAI